MTSQDSTVQGRTAQDRTGQSPYQLAEVIGEGRLNADGTQMILRLLSIIKSRKINTVLSVLVSTRLPYLSFSPGLYGCMITSWMFPYFSATAAMFRIVSNRSEELSPMPEKSRNAVVRTSDYFICYSYISHSLPHPF